MGQVITFTPAARQRVAAGASPDHFRDATKMMPQATYDQFVRLAEQAARRHLGKSTVKQAATDAQAENEMLQLLRRIDQRLARISNRTATQ